MAKRWYASSRREKSGAERAILAATVALVFAAVAAAGIARADDPAAAVAAPTGVTAATGLDMSFLLLSALDVVFDGNKPQKIQVGDVLDLEIPAIDRAQLGLHPQAKDFKLIMPPGTEPLAQDGFALMGPIPQPSPNEYHFKAAVLKPGKITLPSLEISEGGKAVARTNPLTVDAESVIKQGDPKAQEPAPMRPPVSLSFPLVLVAIGLLLLAALVTLIVYGVKRWNARKPAEPPPLPAGPPKPEDEIALTALAALEKQALWKRNLYKQHFFGVSEALKAYIGARYRFDALESTSHEIITHLESKPSLDRVVDRIESLLERLDRVKFTDYVPTSEESVAVIEDARSLVLSTRRPPSVMTSAPPSASQGGQ